MAQPFSLVKDGKHISNENPVPTSIVGSLTKLRKSGVVSKSESINAGGTETFTIFAPAGYLSRIIGVGLTVVAPVGATTGSHTVAVYFDTVYGQTQLIAPKSAVFNAALSIPFAETISALRDINISETIGLVIQYRNITDAVQSNIRAYYYATVDRRITE
jgi:hypothetical protein